MDDDVITIDGVVYDPDSLTLGELEWLEDELGTGDIDPTSPKALVRIVYLLKKRDQPDLTLDEVRQIPISSLNTPAPEPEAKAAAKKRPTRQRRT